MTNNNQTAPVTDEELDQMIWKLERDGMTPKQLSLMRELREVRRAKGEPVAWIVHARTGDQLTTDSGYVANAEGISGLHSTPLYTAQPAPVVPDVIATDDIPYSVGRFRTHRDCYRDGWNACRAAMLQPDGTLTNEGTMQLSGNSEQLEPVSNRDELPATQFKPVADLYGITSPTGSETSFTFDAIEAANFIEGGWSVQEYVELERYQEAMIGNSPATPDGWIPVSERMPDNATGVLVASPWQCAPGGYAMKWAVLCPGHPDADSDGWVIPGASWSPTHWHPLPAAPKEVG